MTLVTPATTRAGKRSQKQWLLAVFERSMSRAFFRAMVRAKNEETSGCRTSRGLGVTHLSRETTWNINVARKYPVRHNT
jgi:hypothetical protein